MSEKSKYLDPDAPGSFSGVSGYAKNQKISIKDSKVELLQIPAYVKHKSIRKKFQMRTTIVSFPRDQLQLDLIDLSKFARHNNGYKYILHGIHAYYIH
jgi:hypothetical protein